MPLGNDYTDPALDAVVDSWPASGAEYHLYASNPQGLADPTTVELTSTGGYGPVAFAPSDFAASSGNAKTTTVPVSFGTSSGPFSDVANFWGIADSGGTLVYSNDLDVPIAITAVGQPASFTPTLTFSDAD